MDLGVRSIIKILVALSLKTRLAVSTPRLVQLYYRRANVTLTNLVSVLPVVLVEAQDKVLHIFSLLLSHELQMHWTCLCMLENNSKEDELYPPIWFSFWSPQTPKEVLPVKGGKKEVMPPSNQASGTQDQSVFLYKCSYTLTFHTLLLPESSNNKCCPWLSNNQSTICWKWC